MSVEEGIVSIVATSLTKYGVVELIVLIVIIAAVTFVQFRLQRRWVHYE